jgi:hypothetical protein
MERCVRNGEMCMYFVYDFNRRWLRDSNIFCCISIQFKSVESIIVDIG